MRVALAALAALALGCDAGAQAPEPTPTGAAPPAQVPSAARGPTRAGPCEIVAAPAGEEDAAAVVQRELARAKKDEKDLLVYVGATWCEPCQRLHEAVVAGQLDKDFPGLRLVEFDADRDDVRLRRAGYLAKMIPLLAVPREDGTASGKQIEGGIKGPGAVGHIRPRLRRMIDEALRQ